MKLMKRSGIYQCSNYNCTFDPKSCEAFSYRWWKFVAKVDGLVIFNNYRYSNTTSKHQSKVRSLLEALGIKVDLYLSLPQGINSTDLSELITQGEEQLCNEFLRAEAKRDERNERARIRRAEKRNAEFEKAMSFIANHAMEHGLGVVDLDGKTVVRISKAVSRE